MQMQRDEALLLACDRSIRATVEDSLKITSLRRLPSSSIPDIHFSLVFETAHPSSCCYSITDPFGFVFGVWELIITEKRFEGLADPYSC